MWPAFVRMSTLLLRTWCLESHVFLAYPVTDANRISLFRPQQQNISSRSGLAGYLYTQDYSRAMRFAGKLEVGMVRSPASLLKSLNARFATPSWRLLRRSSKVFRTHFSSSHLPSTFASSQQVHHGQAQCGRNTRREAA